jgi:hypothetical protein
VLCGLVWTMLPFVAGTFPAHEVGHGPAVVATACVVAGILLFGWFTRAEMMQTTFNRGVFLVALFGVVLHGVLEVFAWIAGLDMVVSHMISVGLWAGVVGIAAIFLDRALLVPMLGFMITIVAIARRPATHLLAMSASIAVLLGVMVYIYLGQKRGRRRIAGLADKLRPR